MAELSEGWTGHLIRQQWLFVGLEGVMVVFAIALLNISHPSFCFDAGSAPMNDEDASGVFGSGHMKEKEADTETSA